MFDPITNPFSRCAPFYDQYASVQQSSFQQVLSVAKDDDLSKCDVGSVLDLGCGTGSNTVKLCDLYPQATILGQDMSQDMIAWASTHNQHPNVQFMFNDLNTYEGRFDRVFSNAALQWIQPLSPFMAMLKTKLNQGARLYMSIYGPETYTELRHVLGIAQGKQAFLASSGFLDAKAIHKVCSEQWAHVSLHNQRIQRRFDSVHDVLRTIKLTGTRGGASPHFQWTPGFLKQVETIYKDVYGTILVSYDIMYVQLHD